MKESKTQPLIPRWASALVREGIDGRLFEAANSNKRDQTGAKEHYE